MAPQDDETLPVPAAQAAFGDLLARLRGMSKEDKHAH
jgi:hypothetical protein